MDKDKISYLKEAQIKKTAQKNLDFVQNKYFFYLFVINCKWFVVILYMILHFLKHR